MKFRPIILFLILGSHQLLGDVDFSSEKVIRARTNQSQKILSLCLRHAKFYKLERNEKYRDITDDLLNSPYTTESHKQKIRAQNRRILIFKYDSDGHEVKGYISITPDYKEAPLLFFLRGGNRILGLMQPANDYSFMNNYTVISTTYRGGVSEGRDEFGGSEVRDVENLVKYIPKLEKELSLELKPPKKFILGASRGGMEMVLALQRSQYLQNYFDRAISLSGPMDLRLVIETREEMKTMFVRDFGLNLELNQDEWLSYRSPIDHCEAFNNDFPLLFIQGGADIRTHIDHGRSMYEKCKDLGKNVTYWEFPDATHCLDNHPERIQLIAQWLEGKSSCERLIHN